MRNAYIYLEDLKTSGKVRPELPMTQEEKYIVTRLKAGNADAFKWVFDNYYEDLCLFAYSFLKNKYHSESIVEDVVFNIWRRHELLEINVSLRSYLLQAVKHGCINLLKTRTSFREVSMASGGPDLFDEAFVGKDDSDPSALLIHKETKRIMEKELDNLPGKTRDVLILHYFEGKSYKEISKERNITIDTVKYHVTKALRALRMLHLDKKSR